jgi:hypothetical protein
MATSQVRDDVVGGNFRIHGKPVEKVLALVKEWRSGSTGHRFQYLAVRDCTPYGAERLEGRVDIDFLYQLPGEKDYKTEHNDFFQKYKAQLQRLCGNAPVHEVRWSMSTPVTLVLLD